MARLGGDGLDGGGDDDTGNMDDALQDTNDTGQGGRRSGAGRAVNQQQEIDQTVAETTPSDTPDGETGSGGGAQEEFEQGIEAGDSDVSQQAQEFETRLANQYGVSPENISIDREGDELVADVSEQGVEETVTRALSRPGTANRAAAVSSQQQQQGDFLDEDTQQRRQGAQESVEAQQDREQNLEFAEFRPAARSTPGGSRVPGPLDDMDSRASDPGTPRAQLRGGRVLAAERDLESGDLTISVPEVIPSIGGQEIVTLEGSRGDFEPVRDGDTVRFEQVDADDPTGGGRVEQFVDDVNVFLADSAETAGDVFSFGPPAQFASPMFGSPAPRENLGEVETDREAIRAEVEGTTIRQTGGNLVEGAALTPSFPAFVAQSGIEAVEFGQSLLEAAEADTLGDFGRSSARRAVGSASDFATGISEDPVGTASLLAGSLVGTGGVFKAAAKIGPKTSAITRYSIQPGEEIAGVAGGKATRAVAGDKAADRLFPNNEPIFFSEEALIRGAKKFDEASTRALNRAVRRGRIEAKSARFQAAEFVKSERGQAQLVPKSRQVEVGESDVEGAELELEQETTKLRTEAESADAEVTAGTKIEGVRPVSDVTTVELQKEAQSPQVRTDTEQDLRSIGEFDAELDSELESETETETDSETELDQELESEQALEFEQELEAEAEMELEREQELETEPFLLDDPRRRRGVDFGDFGIADATFENPVATPEDILTGGALDVDADVDLEDIDT